MPGKAKREPQIQQGQGRLTVKVIYEGETWWVIRRIKSAFDQSTRSAVAVFVYNEDGTFLGSDVAGEPSPEMQARIQQQMFGTESGAA